MDWMLERGGRNLFFESVLASKALFRRVVEFTPNGSLRGWAVGGHNASNSIESRRLEAFVSSPVRGDKNRA